MTRIRRFPWITILALVAACRDTSAPIGRLPRALTSAEVQTVRAGNDFSFALFRQLATSQAGANVFVSPLSVSMSFGMAMNGANGATLAAMRTALSVGSGDLAQINAGYKGVIDLLRGLDATTTFQLANSIWYRNTWLFKQSFLDTTKKWFGAQVQGLNFDDAAGSLATINGWVSASTGGRIPTILDQITRDEVMFLINAIYFKGTWQFKFNPAATSPAPFLAADGTTQMVPTMHRGEHLSPLFRSSFSGQLSLIELPYGNGDFVMDILLPPRNANLDSVAASLTSSAWSRLVDSLRDDDAALTLPKFTLQYERTLNDDLTALGAGVAFSDAADFSGMSAGAGLTIEFVKQKAFVDINEDGTVAGASTVTGIVPVSLREYDINRPFIFVIRERLSGTILFMGKILRIP